MEIEGNKISITNPFGNGLKKTASKVKPKKRIPINPITKKLLQEFNSVAGIKIMDKMNIRARELYEKIPGLNSKIKAINEKMLEVAVEVELGNSKPEKYEKLENDLKDLNRQKSIALLATQEIYKGQQALKKEAVRQVTKEARKLITPVVAEWDKILYRIEELKKEERIIRNAFCQATGVQEGHSYGYVCASPSFRTHPGMWRRDVKSYLGK